MGTERVLIAMSGGVDSSVAAARLVDRGWDVVGITLHLWDYPSDAPAKSRCCAPEDVHDARRVADHLGIPHYSFDRRQLFHERVIQPFVAAYLAGETPSPCVQCNRTVKMRELLPLADRLDATHVATGHYARIASDSAGRTRLHRGRDPQKDQSYFLYMLREDELARVLFPLGEATKTEVRDEAVERELPGALKGESQELCFVSHGHYADFVEKRADGRVRPGPIVDHLGNELGQHDGVHRFTVGQRKHLGVATGERAFVTDIDGVTHTVTIGDSDAVHSQGALLDRGDWTDDTAFPLRAQVKVRSRAAPVWGSITKSEDASGALVLRFDEPVRAVAPGQIAVAYDGDRVLGGAQIVRAVRAGAAREQVAS